ncbi:phosphoadenosine phosphosulfate reductase family protein [Cupriavidus sp.]|jgi:3'-phosphoadenosine 5'-phosphosulfate sulfotransferase (PAPS reductase)/FAD synthetase|uniref:phosphoadenosine phosphosulfate reductase family protein n=1 Tax=Cupriavidus sp. TaxID=1873897 RepID=UPI0025C0429E|nr:phosphoadenosine phosphosulfate reductase family protein [Cupriavidus sp.]HDC7024555.1 phosphoadenosine phosphosulfate reductase family protein [Staphylococcus aureus]
MDMSVGTQEQAIRFITPKFLEGAPAGKPNQVGLSPEVESMLARDAVVAVGVSGGKDSDACAIAVARHLDQIGHKGPRLLVHSDLGRIEWKDSLPSCERLAHRLGWELLVVRRQAGDMLDRWEVRWQNSVSRYEDMSCVKLILPWSTPSMRFCTSEMKTHLISSALRKRFPQGDILNVTGIRRQESKNRSKMPIWAPNSGLTRKSGVGMTWNAIIDWPVQDVVHAIHDAELELHEAYTKYGMSRVSCSFCIMSSEADLIASAMCEDNHEPYIRMVELEARSSFAFQGNRWLSDVAPHVLPPSLRIRADKAKAVAAQRQVIEAAIPEHLLYTAGWPTCLPSREEAGLLAGVRTEVSALLGLNAQCLDATSVLNRYGSLLELKVAKGKAGSAEDTYPQQTELCFG